MVGQSPDRRSEELLGGAGLCLLGCLSGSRAGAVDLDPFSWERGHFMKFGFLQSSMEHKTGKQKPERCAVVTRARHDPDGLVSLVGTREGRAQLERARRQFDAERLSDPDGRDRAQK